ncbi:polyprenyl synthetase family protein [Lacticaseibacillus porcinae]|uniref:polyprenyl synthetase family protein n=1 Tax=Lacticaseibacillus porcinae TaxID=1123687 RepID=UPI0013DE5AFD|nr:polyprenyl synthetase family protein [Lacticaseibacillus porcinae]
MDARLNAIQAKLLAQVKLDAPPVEALVKAQIQAGGKMLRAQLLLDFADFGESDQTQVITAAAAIEALHLATLLHDDVLDDADLRRGVPTVGIKAGNRAAIYAGDFMFAVYFNLLAESDLLFARHAQVMKAIFMGELAQNFAPKATDVEAYLTEIQGKSAALFGLAAEVGATLGGVDAHLANVFGRSLGMSFQIIDDVLDFTSTDDQLQKPIDQDLKNGVYSLPIIYALTTAGDELTRLMQSATTRGQAMAEIKRLGVPPAQQVALAYQQQALHALEQFPDGVNKNRLTAIAELVLSRKV